MTRPHPIISRVLPFLALAVGSGTALAAPIFSRSGLPDLDCFNDNYRASRLETSSTDSSLEFMDTMPMVSDPKLLDAILGKPGISAQIRGFQVVGIHAETDSCRYLESVPYVFHCDFQFGQIRLLGASGQVLATAANADLDISTAISQWSIEGDDFELSGTVTVTDQPTASQPRFAEIKTRYAWFTAGGDQFSGCKLKRN